jgi:hypothetical protein
MSQLKVDYRFMGNYSRRKWIKPTWPGSMKGKAKSSHPKQVSLKSFHKEFAI